MKCPHCKKDISEKEIASHLGARGGAVGGKATGATEKQKEASRLNGKLGGRPKKIKKEDSSK
jgi:hypothetical protein